MLPGDIAPALIELIPYDIIDMPGFKKSQNDLNQRPKKTVRANEFYQKQTVYLNKGDQFIVPENCKPEWQKLQQDTQQEKKFQETFNRGGAIATPK